LLDGEGVDDCVGLIVGVRLGVPVVLAPVPLVAGEGVEEGVVGEVEEPTGLCEVEMVGVWLGVGDCDGVGVDVSDGVGVCEEETVDDGVGVGVVVSEGVGLCEAETVEDGVGVGLDVSDKVGVGEDETVDV
jgi:hypothetical protein